MVADFRLRSGRASSLNYLFSRSLMPKEIRTDAARSKGSGEIGYEEGVKKRELVDTAVKVRTKFRKSMRKQTTRDLFESFGLTGGDD